MDWKSQRSIDVWRDGDRTICRGILTPGGACLLRKQDGEYHEEYVLRSEAEAAVEKARWDAKLDAHSSFTPEAIAEGKRIYDEACANIRARVERMVRETKADPDRDPETKEYNSSIGWHEACDEILRRLKEDYSLQP